LLPVGVMHETGDGDLIELLGLASGLCYAWSREQWSYRTTWSCFRLVLCMKQGTLILYNYLVSFPAGVIHEAGDDDLIGLLGFASNWCHAWSRGQWSYRTTWSCSGWCYAWSSGRWTYITTWSCSGWCHTWSRGRWSYRTTWSCFRLVSYMKQGTMILYNYLVFLPAGVIYEAGDDDLIELLGFASGWCHTWSRGRWSYRTTWCCFRLVSYMKQGTMIL
jgi:hypothetical protein